MPHNRPKAAGMKSYSILDFGAAADGVTNDAPAIQRAIDAAHAAGGGRVIIPSGARVLAGSFVLRSGIDFHVAEGAVLLSATNIESFPWCVFSSGEEADKRVWIRAKDAEDISLSGSGTIDGQCRAFALGETEHIFSPTLPWRPAMTCFENVKRISVKDLTLRNAANWTLHFTGCEDVEVTGVRIFNDKRFPNADGIDPDHCRRVRIRKCHIVSADDCIVLKNTAPFVKYGPCEDVEISDCTLESASAAFKIGSESHGDFRRVRVSNCRIDRSNRGLAIQLRDSGNVEDVEFRNIRIQTQRFAPVWWGAGEAIYITALPRAEGPVGIVRDIRFFDIRSVGENGIVIFSEPSDRIGELLFERVHIAIERKTPWESGILDLRPFQGGFVPKDTEPIGDRTPWGFACRRAPVAISVDGTPCVTARELSVVLPQQEPGTWSPMNPGAAAAGFHTATF